MTENHIDLAQSFQIEGQSVRGRVVTLMGNALHDVLARHAYPEPISRLLGEAAVLAALSMQSLKIEGRVLVQAEGNGPITTLVAEVSSWGGMRGYAKLDGSQPLPDTADESFSIQSYFGQQGRLSFIIIQDNANFQPYQGIVPLSHPTLAECAEAYFNQSEQIPTSLKLSVAAWSSNGQVPQWVARGIMAQKIAGDTTRGDTDEDWTTAQAIMATLEPAELADPNISTPALLYRLFHETGVRLEDGVALADKCSCSRDRLLNILRNMPKDEIDELMEEERSLTTLCEFCGREYVFTAEEF